MHCYLVDGVYVSEIRCLLDRLKPHGLGPDVFHRYLQNFKWPAGYADAKTLCRAGKDLKHKASGSASEFLSSVPILHKYLIDLVKKKGVCDREVRSGVQLCEVLGLLSRANAGVVDPDTLDDAIRHHLAIHQVAYGYDLWKPKAHYCLHLASHLADHSILLSTFLMERKHRVLKRMATPRCNLQSYEKGLVEEVTVQHLWDLRGPLVKPTLLEARAAGKKLRRALEAVMFIGPTCAITTSKAVCINCRVSQMDDTVAFVAEDGSVGFGQMYFHAQVEDTLISCISPWTVVNKSAHVAKCVVVDQPQLFHTECIVESCVFWPAKAGEISQVILPEQVKQLMYKAA